MPKRSPWFGVWSWNPKLLRRHLEEQIIALVPLGGDWLEESRSSFLNGRSYDECLREKGWTKR